MKKREILRRWSAWLLALVVGLMGTVMIAILQGPSGPSSVAFLQDKPIKHYLSFTENGTADFKDETYQLDDQGLATFERLIREDISSGLLVPKQQSQIQATDYQSYRFFVTFTIQVETPPEGHDRHSVRVSERRELNPMQRAGRWLRSRLGLP